MILNPLMPGGNKKVTHTYTSLQLKVTICALEKTGSDIFKFEKVWLENKKEEVILGITID